VIDGGAAVVDVSGIVAAMQELKLFEANNIIEENADILIYY